MFNLSKSVQSWLIMEFCFTKFYLYVKILIFFVIRIIGLYIQTNLPRKTYSNKQKSPVSSTLLWMYTQETLHTWCYVSVSLNYFLYKYLVLLYFPLLTLRHVTYNFINMFILYKLYNLWKSKKKLCRQLRVLLVCLKCCTA